MPQPTNIIYLASKSPRRRELLKQIGVQFELLMIREQSSRLDVDESPLAGEVPRDYVERIVLLKAAMGQKAMRERRLPTRLILTADTTVTIDGEILGKPVDREDAMRMLRRLSGNSHQVLTAIAVAAEREVKHMVNTSIVTFAELSDEEIKRYVVSGEPMDKAGGYAVQGLAAKYISILAGSYSGVMGLPLYETTTLLRQCGLNV
ncbi:MAG: Maf family protein [Usitatibacteraceae bacterium]